MENTKKINVKNRTYYFFNDFINIKDFYPSLIKIDKKSYKNIGIYHIGYIRIKSISDCENINSVNPLYMMIGEVDRYIEENNGNKYLTFASTNKNKKVLEKYTKLWDKIKYHIKTINADKSGECNSIECNSIEFNSVKCNFIECNFVEYKKDYMRIRFNSDDDLPLNKIVKLRMLTIIVRSVFFTSLPRWLFV